MTRYPGADDPNWRKALAEASAWLLRMRESSATSADQESLKAWLAANPLNRKAYESAIQTLDAVRRLDRDLCRALDQNVVRRRARRALVAGVMGAAALSLVIFGSLENYAVEAYATGIGERRAIALDEATHVTLNTQSRLSAQPDAGLGAQLANGEALFDIAADRPQLFVVEAKGLRIRARNAQFLLHTEQDSLCVLVLRGDVDISEINRFSWLIPSDEDAAIHLVAGQQLVRTGEVNEIAAVSDAEIRRRLSWRAGWLEFDGQSLLVAAREISRYSNARFEIEDLELQRLPVVVRVRTGDLETFLFALETGYPMLAVDRRGDVVRIFRRP